MNSVWIDWVSRNWVALDAAKKVSAPSYLLHPASAGFVRETIATNEGQSADWVLPLADGSRIHVHEFVDGRLVVHRDRIDPNRSPLHAVTHFALETELGRFLAVVLVTVSVARLMRSAA